MEVSGKAAIGASGVSPGLTLRVGRLTTGEIRDDAWRLHDAPYFREVPSAAVFLLYATARSTWGFGYSYDDGAFVCHAYGPGHPSREVSWIHSTETSTNEERRAVDTLFRTARRDGRLRKAG